MEYTEPKNWPKGADGKPEKAVRLENAGDFAAYGGVTCSLLEAFEIPYLIRRTGMGQVGFLYGGFSLEGVDIYVPASRLQEARELLSAPPALEEDPEGSEA